MLVLDTNVIYHIYLFFNGSIQTTDAVRFTIARHDDSYLYGIRAVFWSSSP